MGWRGGNLVYLMMQIAVLEEQKIEATENESAEKVEEEPKTTDVDSSAAEPTCKNETLDEKPDINDVPMEESQVLFCLCLHLLHVSLHSRINERELFFAVKIGTCLV